MTTGDPTLRWQLHRAGIMNVYQYGDDVLRLAGGRLLRPATIWPLSATPKPKG